ncbi:MAG: hypothetical protein ACW99G_01190 [Candidatus Thorarchaeota archaeon]|jgi:hypothetical protein
MQKITPKQTDEEQKPIVKQQAKKKGCGCGSKARVILDRSRVSGIRRNPVRENKRNLNRQISRQIKQRKILM